MIERLDSAAIVTAEIMGGKAAHLSKLHQQGWTIPPSLALSIEFYRQYMEETGLGFRLELELGRKPMGELRWEELWDLAQRVHTLFLSNPIPPALQTRIQQSLPDEWLTTPLAIRSSAPEEDHCRHSFAGLHESLIGIRGWDAIEKGIRTVWASLWSDRALLYRKELHLSVKNSAMAVVLQPLITGRASGILFTQSPDNPGAVMIEAVHGLNQGLVDGVISPDRWHLERSSGDTLQHTPPEHRSWMRTAGHQTETLPAALVGPPLTPKTLRELHQIAQELEAHFGQGMDVEWTLLNNRITLLQVRPITEKEQDPEREWYLSLSPSLETLRQLRQDIEQQVLPAMAKDADRLSGIDLKPLSDIALASHLEDCRSSLQHWEAVYRDQLIPMAHGIRLFGRIYNERLQPKDGFAFTRILAGSSLLALKRNRLIQRLASCPAHQRETELQRLKSRFDLLGVPLETVRALAEQGSSHFVTEAGRDKAMEQAYFASFSDDEEGFATQLLDLGRAAWRLRDDDNLYMERLRQPFRQTVQEIQYRLEQNICPDLAELDLKIPHLSLPRRQFESPPPIPEDPPPQWRLQKRQLVGQPASAGLASGPARLIHGVDDLKHFQAGDILVCDALDPTLTLVAPLAAAIVERRGGMLIHGAIIAREYGLPCVTGVPQVTEVIQDGDRLTVDGHLGLVTLATPG